MDRKVPKYNQKSSRDLSENGCQGPKSVSGLGLESVSLPISLKIGPEKSNFRLERAKNICVRFESDLDGSKAEIGKENALSAHACNQQQTRECARLQYVRVCW